MTGRFRVAALTALLLILGSSVAVAQTVGPDEAIEAGGTVTQKLVLTPAQKSAIYNAVAQQHLVDASSPRVTAAVGAVVPPSVELHELPDQAAADDPSTTLKYATVENGIVVIDPIEMRVVEVIHDIGKP